MKAVAQELKSLEAEENDIAEAIELPTQKLASTTKEIDKACQMIAKAPAILNKAELAQHTETNKLTVLTARSIHI